jgi:hypothetical protein
MEEYQDNISYMETYPSEFIGHRLKVRCVVTGAHRELRVEREDGVDLHLLAFCLPALVPLHGDRPRLQVDPGDDCRVDPSWNHNNILMRLAYS